MPYLQLDVDAMKAVPDAARSAGVTEEALGWGLARMWLHCWRTKTDTVSLIHLMGFFGSSDTTRLPAALEAFGFVESQPSAGQGPFRVRGASKRLKVTKAQSEAGKRHASNLIPGGQRAEQDSTETRRWSREGAEEESRLYPRGSLGSASALTPSTQHPTPNTRKEEKPRAREETPPAAQPDNPVAEVFEHWRQTFHVSRQHWTMDEEVLIRDRLRDGHSVDELKRAVTGLSLSRWHRDKGMTALRYALETTEKVERCAQWATAPPDGPVPVPASLLPECSCCHEAPGTRRFPDEPELCQPCWLETTDRGRAYAGSFEDENRSAFKEAGGT